MYVACNCPSWTKCNSYIAHCIFEEYFSGLLGLHVSCLWFPERNEIRSSRSLFNDALRRRRLRSHKVFHNWINWIETFRICVCARVCSYWWYTYSSLFIWRLIFRFCKLFRIFTNIILTVDLILHRSNSAHDFDSGALCKIIRKQVRDHNTNYNKCQSLWLIWYHQSEILCKMTFE